MLFSIIYSFDIPTELYFYHPQYFRKFINLVKLRRIIIDGSRNYHDLVKTRILNYVALYNLRLQHDIKL